LTSIRVDIELIVVAFRKVVKKVWKIEEGISGGSRAQVCQSLFQEKKPGWRGVKKKDDKKMAMNPWTCEEARCGPMSDRKG